ncbi:MAG: hypothetical protein ACLQNE_20160 [Thermoguttaceae bacterium]
MIERDQLDADDANQILKFLAYYGGPEVLTAAGPFVVCSPSMLIGPRACRWTLAETLWWLAEVTNVPVSEKTRKLLEASIRAIHEKRRLHRSSIEWDECLVAVREMLDGVRSIVDA